MKSFGKTVSKNLNMYPDWMVKETSQNKRTWATECAAAAMDYETLGESTLFFVKG